MRNAYPMRARLDGGCVVVTLPRNICRQLGITSRSLVIVHEAHGVIHITPLEETTSNAPTRVPRAALTTAERAQRSAPTGDGPR